MPVEDWVTIADFSWLAEAQILKSALEGSGIEAFIPEEHISSSTALSVRVQVRSSQVEDAKALVDEIQKTSPQEPPPRCKVCGNEGVKVSPVGIKGYLLFIVCALIMVPMKSNQKKVCAHCGNKIFD